MPSKRRRHRGVRGSPRLTERWILLPYDRPEYGVSSDGRIMKLANGDDQMSNVVVVHRLGPGIYDDVQALLSGEDSHWAAFHRIENSFYDSDRHAHEKDHANIGESNGASKLSDAERLALLNMLDAGARPRDAARRFNISERQVYNIKDGAFRDGPTH